MNRILYLFFAFALLTGPQTYSQNIFTGTNNWNSAGNWSLGWVPLAGENVQIDGICTVNINTAIVANVVVNGTLNFTPNNLSDLKLSNSLTINSTGTVNNDGTIEHTNGAGTKNFIINGNGTYVHNAFNNILLDESIFIYCAETFSTTSNLIIRKWFDISIPVGEPSRVGLSNFGNVTLSVNTTGLRWNQKGFFGISRIKGTFTITDGIIMMDDGQGGSTVLTLQAVTIRGTGSMIVRTGFAPSYTFTTGTFTDSSLSVEPTVFMDTTFCLAQWTVGGNLYLRHRFYGMLGSASETGGDLRITVNGNLTINGGTCEFVKQCDAPLRLTVTGSTTISGNPTRVRFVEGNTGLLTFITNDLVISGGSDNVLMGGSNQIPKSTGLPVITINNDLLVSGSSSTYILNSDTSIQKLRMTIGRDFIMSGTGAQFVAANHLGALTVKTTRHFSITGGQYSGEVDTINTAIDSLIVGGDFTFNSPTAADFCKVNCSNGPTVVQVTGIFRVLNSGTGIGQGVYGIFAGSSTFVMSAGTYTQNGGQFNSIYNNKPWLPNGSATITITGVFDQNGGIFRGIYSLANSNSSVITFNVNSVDFDGGYFSAYHTANNNNGISNFNITNDCNVNFTAATDTFMFVGVPYVTPDFCYLTANVIIGRDLIISGVNGAFISSFGKNAEFFNIAGDVNISAGNNSFNPAPPIVSTTHKATLIVGGNVSVSGGTTYLSELNDSLIVTVTGNVNITGGSLIVKGKNGVGLLNIYGGFSQTGGTFSLHDNIASPTSDPVIVTVNYDGDMNGNFSQTGGVIDFDNSATANPAQLPTLIIKSPTYTIGGTGVITRTGTGGGAAQAPGEGNYWGALRFARSGTTNFTRSSTTHNIQQVKQYIDNGTTLDVISGNVQIASYKNTFTLDMINIMNTGVLDLRGNSIKSNLLKNNSGMTVFGRVRLQHPNGLYNNTVAAALDATGGMNYILQVQSTIEYYGTSNQTISGIGLGLATIGSLHKYYNLDINKSGGSWAFPTNSPSVNSTYVRKKLELTAGELNLDNDHITTNGGRSIILEDSTGAAISHLLGYIRSETMDGSGMVKWVIKRATGSHKFWFGVGPLMSDTIPFTFSIPTGNADTVSVSTYQTTPGNAPYPPTVTHVRNLSGADNSSNTVDRFWYINVSGTAASANMMFQATPAEVGSIGILKAQRWIAALNSWEVAYQGSQTSLSYGTSVVNASNFPFWWTLSGNNTPLNVHLLSFSGNCNNEVTDLKWTTASEVNNDYFKVMRSMDGVNYESIGLVEGNGNSTMEHYYKFTDSHPLSKLTYYKIVQTDFDGTTEEFGPVIVRSCKEDGKIDLVVTNTHNGTTNLLIQSPYAGRVNIALLNSEGQILIGTAAFIQEGSNLLPIITDRISAGIYHVRIQTEVESLSKKVFIPKD